MVGVAVGQHAQAPTKGVARLYGEVRKAVKKIVDGEVGLPAFTSPPSAGPPARLEAHASARYSQRRRYRSSAR
ncbi:hypothetical protein GCM10010448_44350 [Streptomyces glomeratus]|uniref:Uncharacterized protein n=1 Tax=Streptomyces glomeratus TaxID=284452 RepID=A0ABP6LU82_9ACTN